MKVDNFAFYNGWEKVLRSFVRKNKWYTSYLLTIIIVMLYGCLNAPVRTPAPYIFTTEELNAKSQIEHEIKMLDSIPGAVYKPASIFFKDHKVRNEYIYFNSQLDFEEVCNHYDKQLQSHGWRKLEGWNGRLWGNDNLVQYKKGEYTVVIERYPENQSNRQYSLAFHWSAY